MFTKPCDVELVEEGNGLIKYYLAQARFTVEWRVCAKSGGIRGELISRVQPHSHCCYTHFEAFRIAIICKSTE